MFIDELNIKLQAGKGGDGIVSWLHEKGKEFSGPAGGNGGNGGNVFVKAVSDIGILNRYRNIKEILAENGESGQKRSRTGKKGEDTTILLPLGSVVTNLKTNKKIQLLDDKEVLILHGGRGGLGNKHFRGSKNVRPKQFTKGKPGDEAEFYIELELIVDIGLVGLPNAGKSSLINAITNTKSKIGSFPFTTIEPSLGSLDGLIIADIPGLIEGASTGKGLGHKFLRHIKRTKEIIHCISAEHEDIVSQYKTIRNELKEYDIDVYKKREIIIITKTDLVSPDELKTKIKELKKENKEVYSISIYDLDSINKISKILVEQFKK